MMVKTLKELADEARRAALKPKKSVLVDQEKDKGQQPLPVESPNPQKGEGTQGVSEEELEWRKKHR